MKPKTEPGFAYKPATRSLRLELLDEDINTGVCGDPMNCPVHHALIECVAADEALVGWRILKVFRGKQETHYQIPTDLGEQIKMFDAGTPCWEPGVYSLKPYPYRDVPDEERASWNPNRHHGGSSKEEKSFRVKQFKPRPLQLREPKNKE